MTITKLVRKHVPVPLEGLTLGLVCAVPKEDVSIHFAAAMANTVVYAQRMKVNIALQISAKLPHRGQALNALIHQGLQHPAKIAAFVIVDPTIGWQPDSFLRVAQHALDRQVGVCGVATQLGGRWTVDFENPNDLGDLEFGGVLRCSMIGDRFLAISRAFIEHMRVKVPAYEVPTTGMYNFFESSLLGASGVATPEHQVFCQRVRAAGLPIYVDPVSQAGSATNLMSQLTKTG